MAKKLYAEVGGASKLVKKLYTEVNGVSHRVKKLYAEVGGVSKLVFNGARPLIYSFSTYANNSNGLSGNYAMSLWYAGYEADGTIYLAIHGSNTSGSGNDIGVPAAKVIMDFAEDLTGKTITFYYNQQFDTDKTYNNFRLYITKNGATSTKGITTSYGSGNRFSHVVEAGTTRLEIAAIAGAVGSVGVNITFTSITVDGEEVLR